MGYQIMVGKPRQIRWGIQLGAAASEPSTNRRKRPADDDISAATTCPLIGDNPAGPLWPSINQFAAYIAICNMPPDEDYTHTLRHTIVISTQKALQAPMQP